MIRLRIACSARFGSNARRLGKSGSVDSVTAAAVADVRVGEHALRQALKLVRAKRSMELLSAEDTADKVSCKTAA